MSLDGDINDGGVVGIALVTWATVRRRLSQLAQTRWALPSLANPSMNPVIRIGLDISLGTTGTGTQTWLPTITLAEVTP
jgi:hypothetical protein